MIQRIQSVWLFLAALISSGLFLFPLYKYETPLLDGVPNSTHYLEATSYYPLTLVATVMTILPLIGIFMFKNRKRQKRIVWGSIFSCIIFIALMIFRIGQIRKDVAAEAISDQYVIPGALLPALPILFLIFALRGIVKDEKLVRSMDRLR